MRGTSFSRNCKVLVVLVATLWSALLFGQTQLPADLPDKWSGEVVGISDGDTVTVLWVKGREKTPIRIRLHGIDCPESHQAYGERARQFTSDAVGRKAVSVEKRDVDQYGRLVGVVLYGGKNLNEELVRAGFAWWYERYAPDDKVLPKLQAEAKKAKRGLWQDAKPIPPWEYRKDGGASYLKGGGGA